MCDILHLHYLALLAFYLTGGTYVADECWRPILLELQTRHFPSQPTKQRWLPFLFLYGCHSAVLQLYILQRPGKPWLVVLDQLKHHHCRALLNIDMHFILHTIIIYLQIVLLQVTTSFSPGNFQGFALVNRQRTNRVSTGFTVEVSTEGTQLSYSNFDYLGQEPQYWQLPGVYQGDKVRIVAVTHRPLTNCPSSTAVMQFSTWFFLSLRVDLWRSLLCHVFLICVLFSFYRSNLNKKGSRA